MDRKTNNEPFSVTVGPPPSHPSDGLIYGSIRPTFAEFVKNTCSGHVVMYIATIFRKQVT